MAWPECRIGSRWERIRGVEDKEWEVPTLEPNQAQRNNNLPAAATISTTDTAALAALSHHDATYLPA